MRDLRRQLQHTRGQGRRLRLLNGLLHQAYWEGRVSEEKYILWASTINRRMREQSKRE